MSFTRALAARSIALSFADLPAEVVATAKITLQDTIAVALAASEERVVTAVREFVALDGGSGPCTLWGSSERANASQAAFVNGTAAHVDFDDVCWAMNAHPSAVLWPTALAVAESIGASGKDALVGYVAGFEAEADLGAVPRTRSLRSRMASDVDHRSHRRHRSRGEALTLDEAHARTRDRHRVLGGCGNSDEFRHGHQTLARGPRRARRRHSGPPRIQRRHRA